MQDYRVVGGPVEIGAGTVLGLRDHQFRPRAHHLEIVRGGTRAGEIIICRAKTVLQFKAGELIGLADPPPKPFRDRFELAERAGRARPKTPPSAPASATPAPAADPVALPL